MKKRLGLLMIIIMVLISSISSYALSAGEVGTYHKDGSYQLSNEELIRYNDLYNNINKTKNNISYADALKYIAPGYYRDFSKEAKENLSYIKFGESSINNQEVEYVPSGEANGMYKGTYASISKYGNSIKGYGSFDRKVYGPDDPKFQYVYMINQVMDRRGNRVAVSHNQKQWTDDSFISISCTTITDPPSGEYYDYAEFAIPEYCIYDKGYKFVDPYVFTDSISYTNPY